MTNDSHLLESSCIFVWKKILKKNWTKLDVNNENYGGELVKKQAYSGEA